MGGENIDICGLQSTKHKLERCMATDPLVLGCSLFIASFTTCSGIYLILPSVTEQESCEEQQQNP